MIPATRSKSESVIAVPEGRQRPVLNNRPLVAYGRIGQ